VGISPAGAGTITGGGAFVAGTQQTLTAQTNGGFEFAGWTGNATGTNNPLTVTIQTNLTITANFASVATNITLAVSTNGFGVVTPNLNGENLKKDHGYILTAKPAPGNLFSNWTGSITTNKNPLTIKAVDSMVLQANFVTNPFLTVNGTFNGLFSPTNGVTEETSGMLKGLKITGKGTYTGTLLINGGSHPINGSFGLDGQATNEIKRSSAQGGLLTIMMSLNGLPPAQITGTVQGTDWQSGLLADEATNRLASAEYTALLLPDTNNAPPFLSPGGAGYLLITNYDGSARNPASASARLTGALADGTIIGETVPVSQEGYVPIYTSLYGGKGLFMGWINLELTNTERVGLTWISPKREAGLLSYRAGFTNTLSSNQILLSPWTNSPASFTALSNLSFLSPTSGANTSTNLTLSIPSSGKLTSSSADVSVNPKTGLLKVTVDRVTGTGAIVPSATFGGGYILTKTNSQTFKLEP
jgi:uncharacterized repeat protein (TIGR02543 family)